jgi:hypothetical protein
MSVINAEVEQIWQTIESLPPEGREIIRERLGFEKPTQSSSKISSGASLDDAIFKISFEDYLALSDDERDSIHTSANSKYRNWIDAELERREAEWMLVAGGDVIEAGETLDEYPPREKLYKLGYHWGVIPFVFVANPIIEESLWAALPKNDFYPTISMTVGSSHPEAQQNSLTMQADLDTGSFHTMLNYDDLLQNRIIDRQPVDQAYEASHLEFKYKYLIAPVRIGMIDETGKMLSANLSVACVRNWQQSPFCFVNAFRKALIGRGLLLKLPLRVELNGQDRSTKVFSIAA